MAWIQMRDFWTFRPTEVQENKKHLFECKDSKSDSGHSLLVHVAATHAGIVNGNRRFYRPDKMQDGVHTWLPQKTEDGTVLRTPRPVLVGHNEQGDVLGRVLEAKYIDESWKYASDFPVVKDFLFYQRDGRKRKTLFDSVDWVVENLVPLTEYTGLGYTDLGLRITNPEAIRKVLADEYLTVSVGFKTDAAVCSLCHTDWAKDGKCGHKLGEIEDGKDMFLIAGEMHNSEVSFINFAADPFATTLSKKVMTDSLAKTFFLGLPITEQTSAVSDGLQLTDGLIFEADMVAAEEPMELPIDISALALPGLAAEVKSAELTKQRANELKDALKSWAPESEDQKSNKRSLVSTLNAKIRRNGWDKVEDSQVSEADAAAAEEVRALMDASKAKPEETAQDSTNAPAEEEVEDAVETWDELTDEEREYFADEDGLYAELELELDGSVTDGLLDAAVVTDAKLSSEKRKKLADGSFCGPNRSFPVADCAHVTAARRLVGRAKVSDSTKSKILACVDRKAAKLSCGDSKKAQDAKAPVTDDRYTKIIDSVVIKDAAKKEIPVEQRTSLVSIIKALDAGYDSLPADGSPDYYDIKWILRNAVRSMLDDWSADDSLAWSLKMLAGNKDHVVLTRSELDEKEEALNGLMAEKDSLVAEVGVLKDSRAAILASTKQSLAQSIVMHNVLKGQDGYKDLTPAQTAEKIEALSKRHITSLRDSVSDILSGLKFTDSLPAAPKPSETTGTVDDHTQITDATPSGDSAKDGAQDEVEQARQKFLTKLRFMTPAERGRELGRLRFESSAQTK